MIPFSSIPVLPAVTIEDAALAVPVARALLAGGMDVMEIAFRTPAAAEAVSAIRTGVPEMRVGAGTLLNKDQLHEARDAGAQFGLSPGYNPLTVEEARRLDFYFIPGVMTPGEIEQGLAAGLRLLKLFPASLLGGPAMLRALQGPYGHTGVRFIPMGGVNVKNMADYLCLDNVACVGGSWIAATGLIKAGRFEDITQNAREASAG